VGDSHAHPRPITERAYRWAIGKVIGQAALADPMRYATAAAGWLAGDVHFALGLTEDALAIGEPSARRFIGDAYDQILIHDFTVEARTADEAPAYSTTGGPVSKALATAIAHLPVREAEMGAWTDGLPAQPRVSWADEGQLYGPKDWQAAVRTKLERHHRGETGPRRPIYVDGPIASSDKLVKDPALLIPWLQTARKLIAVEMESGGVYRAAQERCSMLAIRGISDIVGLKRSDDWAKYACASAAAFSRAFLRTRPIGYPL
jgi:nucleoside phosphorylase